MARWRWMVWIAAVAVLGGCGSGWNGPGGDRPDMLREQAREALARYDMAVLDAGGSQHFVPVGDLTGQLGDWEPENGDNKQALLSGRVLEAKALPAAPQPTGEVIWDNGLTHTLSLISAEEALQQLRAAGAGDCPECVPLEVIGARLIRARIQTTRGTATAPAWEYTIKGTAVRVTRVAVTSSVTVSVTPPSWDPYNSGGLAIESATTTTSSRQLTVTFTGTPDPGSQPCGADYSAEPVESVNAVVVIVIEHPHSANEACSDVGARRTTTVDLAQPLGGRAVLEVQQGLPVPVMITA